MIVILTYGKVCSTALKDVLRGHFSAKVFYSHGLQPTTTGLVDDFAAAAPTRACGLEAAFADNPSIRRGLDDRAVRPTIIVGVREPIGRSLSLALQMRPALFPDTLELHPRAAAERLSQHLHRLWLEPDPGLTPVERLAHSAVRAPLEWLKREIEAPFGVDLVAEPLDVSRGYRVIEREHVRILLFRVESAPAAIEAGLKELFGREFRLPLANRSGDKPDFAVLEHLREGFRLPASALDDIYDNAYVRAFLTPEEIAHAKQRWMERPGRTPAPTRVLPDRTPRAAVAMAVLNNQAWVGVQLESLFDQWREDLELVVVDDGSSDGSFEAVQAALAARPGIAATLVRNAAPQGLGVIPQVLQLTRSSILIQADSDDVSLPGRLDAILEAFEADPRCRLVTTNAYRISAEGVVLGLVDTRHDDVVFSDPTATAGRLYDPRWLGATSAFHRSLIEAFPLDPLECPYGLDLLLALRATLQGVHRFLCEPLVGYRQHPQNSHRKAGAEGDDDTAWERYRALELMAAAQRVRDIGGLQASGDDAALALVLRQAETLLLQEVTAWSRARNRRKVCSDGRSASAEAISALPPLISLRPGERRSLGLADPLGQIAAAWSGFHPPEADWNWTERRALLGLRAMGAKALRLGLASPSCGRERPVRVQVVGRPWVEAAPSAALTEVVLPLDGVAGPEVLTLRIEAEGAVVPAEASAEYAGDARLLGAALFWIEAI